MPASSPIPGTHRKAPLPTLPPNVRAVLVRLVDPPAEAHDDCARTPSATTLPASGEARRRLLLSVIGHLLADPFARLRDDRAFVVRCVAAARECNSRSLRRASRARRNREEIATEVAYFGERRSRMRHDRFQHTCIPLGSGAMESAVRRVVDVRREGAGTFWTTTSTEAVMHLRSHLEAGRWDGLTRRVVERSPDGYPVGELRSTA